MPKTREEYWNQKFQRNVKNDLLHKQELEAMGWKVITIWECQLKKANFITTMETLEEMIKSQED